MAKHKKQRVPDDRASKLVSFEARTAAQQVLINLIKSKEVIVASGSSGVGKTYVALATALGLLEKGFKKIILVKSVTSIPGESIGFIPGTYEDKMEPYLMSYTWNIDKILGKNAAEELMHKGLIEIMPIAYIRGLSIDDSIVIIDEAQNIDKHTFKTIITRIGENSKYIFLGDTEQVDRKRKEESCLDAVLEAFKDRSYVGTLQFGDDDCVRNPLIPKILDDLAHYHF
jgi:phosphate starvation-inducible PhoH-like protein